MRIKAKVLWTSLGLSLIVTLVGLIAVNRQRAAGVLGATKEAEEVAHVLGLVFMADENPSHDLTKKIAGCLSKELGQRDIEVIDSSERILVDMIRAKSGSMTERLGTSVDESLRDGRVRTFFEFNADYPLGIREIIVPVKTESGEIAGAVIMEYTPLFSEMMGLAMATEYQVVIGVLTGAVMALALALYIGNSLAAPLRQLTKAATAFATGRDGMPMPPPRGDEIGELTAAFNVMIEKRQQAQDALRRACGDMEVRVRERTAELAATNEQLQAEVAERRLAEEAAVKGEESVRSLAEDLARERGRFANILNTVPAVVFENWAFGGKNRTFVNNYVETMYGYTAEEWFSTPDFWSQRVHPDDREHILKHAADLFAGKTASGKQQFRWLTKDGRVIWGETYLKVIHDQIDGAKGVCGFTLDITERKQAEQELEVLHQQVIEASRHAGMAEVATGVLHNVGNVLNSVNISAALATEHVRQSSASHLNRVAALLQENASDLPTYLSTDPIGQKLPGFLGQLAGQLGIEQATILEELKHLGNNVEHIKDIVAVQQSYASAAGMSQTVGIIDLVEDSLRMNAGALMRHDVELIREFEASPVISVDKHKVMQVLVNLIRNAKYACDESGRPDKRLTVRVTGDESVVRIAVSDNGVGIAAENMTRIFSHGFTTRATGHGFGLHSGALAAKEMAGTLLAQSDGLGLGATFTLELPLGTAPTHYDV
jgi:PAS domain S-box-containing protein